VNLWLCIIIVLVVCYSTCIFTKLFIGRFKPVLTVFHKSYDYAVISTEAMRNIAERRNLFFGKILPFSCSRIICETQH